MARPAALGPMQSTAARQMRRTAGLLDADHPETIAGDHVRDAAKVLEHGSTDGAKRHLDAAMGLLTPQNLVRHGIRDDEGHATAKHHMHQIHRHHLIVQDIEDSRARNEQLREALRASRQQIKATTQQAVAGPPQLGHAPPGYQRPSQPATALAVELSLAERFYRYKHGWIPIGDPEAAGMHGQVVHGRDRRFRPVHGKYDHATRTIDDAKRGKVPVQQVAKTVPQPKKRGRLSRMFPSPAAGLSNEIELRNVSKERRDLLGRWSVGGPSGFPIYKGDAAGGQAMLNAMQFQPSLHEKPASFFGTQGSVFGSRLSRREAIGAAAALAPKPMKPGQLHPGQQAQFDSLSKAQKVIYKKLRGRGRAHAGAHLIASTFKPGMLESAVLANSNLGALLLASSHGRHIPGTPFTYKHGWARIDSQTQAGRFGAGLLPGSFEHINAIEDLAERAGAGVGDPSRRSLTMRAALRNVASAVGGRDMRRARVHLDAARWANQHEARGYYSRDLRDLRRQLELVPPGVTGWEGKIRNPLSPAGQHPGKFVATSSTRPPAHPAAGARLVAYQTYSTTYPESTWPAATTRATSGSNTREVLLARIAARRAVVGGPGTGHSSTAGTARAPATIGLSASLVTTGTTITTGSGRVSATATPSSLSSRYSTSGRGGLRAQGRSPGSMGGQLGASRGSSRAGTGPGSLELSAETARLERTPAPRGKPGGPGLYHVKGMGHTAYFQNVVRALIDKRGMPEAKAYRIAWGALRKWRRGGGHVHPEVAAAATGALAGEAARGARAHSHTSDRARATELSMAWLHERRNRRGEWDQGGGGKYDPAKTHRMEAAAGIEPDAGLTVEMQGKDSGELEHESWNITDPQRRKAAQRELQARLGSGQYTLPKGRLGPNLPQNPYLTAKYGNEPSFSNAADGWDVADVLIELAAEPIDLFNPYHAPTGQFTTSGGAGAAQGKKPPPKQKRQQLLKRAASLRSQIRGLETQLHAATAQRKSRSSRPAKKGAAATSAKQARQARQTAAKAGKITARTKAKTQTMSPATIRAKIAVLRGQLQATLAQLKRL